MAIPRRATRQAFITGHFLRHRVHTLAHKSLDFLRTDTKHRFDGCRPQIQKIASSHGLRPQSNPRHNTAFVCGSDRECLPPPVCVCVVISETTPSRDHFQSHRLDLHVRGRLMLHHLGEINLDGDTKASALGTHPQARYSTRPLGAWRSLKMKQLTALLFKTWQR